MKITLEIRKYGKTVSIEVPGDDLTVPQVVENLFRPAMLALTYSEESLDKTIGEIDDDAMLIGNGSI